MQKLYHLVAINNKTEKRHQLTGYPMSHKQCVTMKSKFTPHAHRRIEFVEAAQ
jgi:hypothetical protein